MNNKIKAYIGMGSNLGDGKKTLQDAWENLGKQAGIECLKLSSPYLSAPVDMVSQNWFTNAVGMLATSLSPVDLLRLLLTVEAEFGRRRPETDMGYQDRSLDLDLLYFGEIVMDSEELILPHPHIPKRLFVLEPLAELDAGFCDYATGLTVGEMVGRLQQSFVQDDNDKQAINRSSWSD
ncbi:MAG: 2-amino-4-hydroxy-6-hydroxymethyldihydropteridine diphosphokinase [Desulforhopalus sp.]|jgi:2-amino-4-hydroxy-6-hydroxymethyldihydropteridine diphosphokinase